MDFTSDEVNQFGGSSSTPSNYDACENERFREGMITYVAAAEMPLTMIDSIHFTRLVQKYLQSRKGYIAATAHYIDHLWLLHKRIIAFRYVEFSHNATNIYMVLKDIIQEYDKIRQAINFITVSPARKQAFNSLCAEYGLQEKSFATDVTHRNLPLFADVVRSMELKFCKYWEELPSLFLLASEGQRSSTSQSSFSRNITTNPENLWNYLDSNTSAPSFSSSSSSSTSRAINIDGTNLEISSELARYMCVDVRSVLQPHELQEFSLLNWWRCNERQYPIVSKIARDLLTPPVSTVASEAAFSLGGRVLSDERSRLKEDILEALICLKDWECAELLVQEHVDSIMAEELQHIQT
ncbi:zinc finger BED domain-containing protein RICESLEEPER 1-like [Olea europaea var. sylvestris]|uniref:zinc finger BED domain-containing protein RICESLEEPER 1-like n=1 Tax=Olea europaea var. sylvestris TaxID=158386 RepID=UPI000C1CCCFD|nr:zinc finger BED domain-containing protein RICESLEEPER 1-like [Olea europaea var. sylvestris]